MQVISADALLASQTTHNFELQFFHTLKLSVTESDAHKEIVKCDRFAELD